MDRLKHIHDHFNSESSIFDGRALKILPYYQQMLDALVSNIPFKSEDAIDVIDMGTGTGTVAKLIKDAFPNAKIKCLDIATGMLDQAKIKLAGKNDISFELGEIAAYDFTQKYDAIVSSLAYHHLEPDETKSLYYKKAYEALNTNGILINADVILDNGENSNNVNLKKWEAYMLDHGMTKDDVHQNYERYKREDRPANINDEIRWFDQVGLKDVNIYWKYYNFAVYGGIRR